MIREMIADALFLTGFGAVTWALWAISPVAAGLWLGFVLMLFGMLLARGAKRGNS